MPPTVVFRGTRADLVKALAAVPTALAGRAPDPVGAARGLQMRLSTALLSQVQQDFLVKSRGGVGRDGGDLVADVGIAEHDVGEIAEGKRADLLLLDAKTLELRRVIVGGKT